MKDNIFNIILPILIILISFFSLTSQITIGQQGQDLNGNSAHENFGSEVSISGDGNIIAGASVTNIIRTYVYNGTQWNAYGNTLQGNNVSLSQNGNRLAISDNNISKVYAWDSNSSSWIQMGNDIPYEFRSFSYDGSTLVTYTGIGIRTYEWNGNNWITKGLVLSVLGLHSGESSISADGNIILTHGNISSQVKAYIWSGSAWIQRGSSIDNEGLGGFGNSISLSANGNRVIIGASTNASDRGKILHLDWINGDWQVVYNGKFDLSINSGTNFGDEVQLSADGKSLVVSASGIGDAYLSKWDGLSWSSPFLIEGSPGNQGFSLGLSEEGNHIITGSARDDENGSNSGRIQVYEDLTPISDFCNDNIQNQGETGVDCGGSSCNPCNILYVDPFATFGNNNGTSWSNAFIDLQDALAVGAGKIIRIAKGIYYPTSGTDRSIYFEIPNDATLSGGYPNLGGTRNTNLHPTILSGNIDQVSSISGNSYHVVKMNNANNVVLNGLVISDGNADDIANFAKARGGAIYIVNSKIKLIDVDVTSNHAIYGGGIYANQNSDITIERKSSFKDNQATSGSAIYLNSCSRLDISYSDFQNNSSTNGATFELHNSTSINLSHIIMDNDSLNTTTDHLLTIAANSSDCSFDMYHCTLLKRGINSDLVHIETDSWKTLIANIYNSIISHTNNHTGSFNILNNANLYLNIEHSYLQREPYSGYKTNCLYQDIDGPLVFANGSYILDKCSPGINNGNNNHASQFNVDFLDRARITNIVDMGAVENMILSCEADSPGMEWFTTLGNSVDDVNAYRIITDDQGNIYTLGTFTSATDFDPGPGSSQPYIGSNEKHMFLQKLDSNMNFLWMRRYSIGTADGTVTIPLSVNIDIAGNIIFTSWENSHNAGSYGDIRIRKITPEGSTLWTKTALEVSNPSSGIQSTIARHSAITTDNNGNIYILGHFLGEAYYDNNSNISSPSIYKAYFLKLDSNGDFVWIKTTGETSYSSINQEAILINHNNEIVIASSFTGTEDFDPSSSNSFMVSNGYEDIFISKFDLNGNFISAHQIGGIGRDNVKDIAQDSDNNYIILGSYSNSVDFNPNGAPAVETANGTTDLFLLKLGSNYAFKWVKSFVDDGNQYIGAMDLDDIGNIYLTGAFKGDLNPNISSFGNYDSYILKYNTNGDPVSSFHMGSSREDLGYDIDVDRQNNILATGIFNNTLYFQPEYGTSYNSGYNSFHNQAYILKLDQDESHIPIHVDQTATGDNSGRNWQNAFTDLQDALTIAENRSVLIAQGTYYPTDNASRNASFEIPEKAIIQGGFPSGGAVTANPSLYSTILSGNVDHQGSYDGNSYHVVKVIDSEDVVLRGLTIKDGNANDTNSFGRARGGGLYVKGSRITLEDMDIRWNKAIYGAGLFATLSPMVDIQNSVFKKNTADFGSALYHSNATQMFIDKTKIYDNTSLNRCAIESNNSLYTEISNSLIANNASSNANAIGFIATNRNQTCNIYNSTILGESNDKNLITMQIGNGDILGLNIQNSILAHQDYNFSNNVIAYNSGTLNFSTDHCYIQGASIIGNSNNNLYSNIAGDLMLNNDYSISACSPAADAGNDALANSQTDIDDNQRFYNTVDMGAFENQMDCMPREASDYEREATSFLNIHPNPTHGIIQLESNLEDYTVLISDMLGKQMFFAPNVIKIDMNSFPSGIYILNIMNDGNIIQTKKVMKH